MKVLPLPGSLSTVTRPWCASQTRWTGESIVGRLVDGDDPAQVGDFGGGSQALHAVGACEGEGAGISRQRCFHQRRAQLCARGFIGSEHDAARAIDDGGHGARAGARLGDQRQERREVELDREDRPAAGAHGDRDARISPGAGVRRAHRGTDLMGGAERNAAGELFEVGLVQDRPVGEHRILRARAAR